MKPTLDPDLPMLGSGFGDMLMRPDVTTLFRMPWQPDTAGILCDLFLSDGTPVAVSPRTVLERAFAGLEGSSLTASIGAEPDFLVFQETYEQAFLAGYRNLTPPHDAARQSLGLRLRARRAPAQPHSQGAGRRAASPSRARRRSRPPASTR